MSWQDENPIIGKKTSIDEDNPKVDMPVTSFFPTYSREGEILTGATSGFEALADLVCFINFEVVIDDAFYRKDYLCQ